MARIRVPIGLALTIQLFLPVSHSFAIDSRTEVLIAGRPAQRARAVSNTAPSLDQPADMSVAEGAGAEQSITATDPESDPLQFFKLGGPEFLFARTVNGVAGTGSIQLHPGFIDQGSTRGVVGVSDGLDGATRSFRISVAESPRDPSSLWASLDSTSFSTADDPGHLRIGDLNGDGIEDLAIGHINTGAISVYLGQSGGSYQLANTVTPLADGLTSISIGDFTGDARPDLVVTYVDNAFLLDGHGDGTFGVRVPFPTSLDPGSSDSGDLDGDGITDLVIGDYSSKTVSVYIADGAGHLSPRVPYPAGDIPIGVHLVDLDRDGHLDIAVADAGGTVSILLNNGTGLFGTTQTYPAAPVPYDLAVGDLNGDGWPDIVTASSGRDSVSVLLASGGGIFDPGPQFHGAGYHTPHAGRPGTAFALRDFNADGLADLAMTTIGGVLILPGDGEGGFYAPFVTARRVGGDLGIAIDGSTRDLNGDGASDLILPDRATDRVVVILSDPNPATVLLARAFPSKQGATQIGAGSPFECVQVEPVAGDYDNASVDLTGFAMASTGTGVTDRIAADKAQLVGDIDRNGIPEVEVCFSREHLNQLFANLRGRATVTATIEGVLTGGNRIRAALEVMIKAHNPRPASVHPNPSNPGATLTFDTERRGPVRVRIFDLSGRLVRTVLDEKTVEGGNHEVRIDGRDARGIPLSSGVFFYRIDSPDRIEEGRITILK